MIGFTIIYLDKIFELMIQKSFSPRYVTLNKLIAIALFIGTSQMAQANELEEESPLAQKQTVFELEKYSQKAGDLFLNSSEMITAQRDLDRFCRDYPFNSRCVDFTPSEPETTSPMVEEEVILRETSGWAITPEISTLGLGASVSRSFTPNLNGRLGLNLFSISANIEETDVTYDANLDLLNVSTLLDYYPNANSGFRLSAGAVFNDNKLEGRGVATGQDLEFTINDVTYTSNDLSTLDAKAKFSNSVAPYIGIGWGNPVKPGSNWSVAFSLGAMFTGSPNVSLTPTFPDTAGEAIRNEITDNLREEEREINESLNWLNVYPVLTIGVSYQF